MSQTRIEDQAAELVAYAIAADPPPLCFVVMLRGELDMDTRESLYLAWESVRKSFPSLPPLIILPEGSEFRVIRDVDGIPTAEVPDEDTAERDGA